MLTGVYHLSRRTAQRATKELLGVEISLGAISDIEHRVEQLLEPPVDEAWAKVETAKAKPAVMRHAAASVVVAELKTEKLRELLDAIRGRLIG